MGRLANLKKLFPCSKINSCILMILKKLNLYHSAFFHYLRYESNIILILAMFEIFTMFLSLSSPSSLKFALPVSSSTLYFHSNFEIIMHHSKTFHRWVVKTKPPKKTTLALWVKHKKIKLLGSLSLSLQHVSLNRINRVPTTGFLHWLHMNLWMLIFKDIKTKIKEIRCFQISDTLTFGPIK